MGKSGLKEDAPMTNQRHILAVTLAAGTLVLFLAVIAVGGALRAGLAPWPGIAVVVMATTAFVVSREQGSFLVAGLLAASGVVYGLVTIEFLAVATFPGPVFGVILGLPILGLGVAKGIETGRNRRR
jgi:hypothetical protein